MLVTLVFDHNRAALLAFAFFFDTHRFAFNHIYQPDKTGHFGQNRNTVRIPRKQPFAAFYLLAVQNRYDTAVRNFEPFQLASLFIDNRDLTVAFKSNANLVAVIFCIHRIQVDIFDVAVTWCFLISFDQRDRRNTAGMERSHGQAVCPVRRWTGRQ